MTRDAQALFEKLNPPPRNGPPSGGRAPANLGRLAQHWPLVGAALCGAVLCVGAFLDGPPGERQTTAAAASSASDRFLIPARALPATADGRALTWGALFDLYGLEDEVLRRSLEATLHEPFSLDRARAYRNTPVGSIDVTVVLRP